MEIATATANANIAIIKYWGNRNDSLVLPSNSSLSFTMDEKLQTKTTVFLDDEFSVDELWINDEKAKKEETERVSKFLEIVRKKSNSKLKAKVYSQNSFPKGAGLASSASAFAALAAASSKAYDLDLTPKELSMLARFGSGSASRSIYGGLVEWKKGIKEDGSDCYSEQILPESKLTNLRNIVAVTEKEEKKIGSREGMKITVKTAENFPKRIKETEERLKEAEKALLNLDFQKLAPIVMEESDSMHNIMKESSPSLIYLNKISHEIINRIKELNSGEKEFKGAYTFDAGPNAHIYTMKNNAKEIISLLKEIEGIKEIIECSVGKGIQHSNSHLM